MSEDQDTIQKNGKFKQTILTSIKILGASSVLFLLITGFTIAIDSYLIGRFSPRHIFRVNFYAASILLFTGVMVEFFPVFLPKSKLLDHSTHGEYYVKKRKEKRKNAFKLIYLGFGTIFVTAICQHILSLIL